MSVTKNQVIGSVITYDNGIIVENKSSAVDVTYAIESLDGFDGKNATGVFTVSIAGQVSTERFRFSFAYDGNGNPLDQAEPALQAYFDGVDAKNAAAATATEAETPTDTTADVSSTDDAAEQPATGA